MVQVTSGSDPALLWLWHRPAAVALIQPLAWESPYAKGAARKSNIYIYFFFERNGIREKRVDDENTKEEKFFSLLWILTFHTIEN